MSNTYPGWPEYTDEEIQAVENVLRSGKVNYWTGNEARLFEEEFAAAMGTKHAIALSNGTVPSSSLSAHSASSPATKW